MGELAALFTWLMQALTSKLGNVVLSGSILLAALIIYFALFRPKCRRLAADLRDAIAYLERIPDEAAFAQRFEQADRWLRQHALLTDAWGAFAKTLLFPRPQDQPVVIRYSGALEEGFGAAAVLYPHLNLRFYTAVPNYLTGAGILGTFIGLVAGIYLASKGLTQGTTEQFKQALQYLLSGASLAFWTSIMGLSCSIPFSMAEKRRLHGLDNLLGRWRALLDRRLVRITPEQLAAQEIAESARQSLQLERFNTDLAVSIAKALDTQLSSSLAPTLQRMLEALERQVSAKAETNERVLKSLVEEFRGALAGATGTEMESLRGTLQVLQQNMEATTRATMEGQTRLVELTERITADVSQTLTHNTEALQEQTLRAVEAIAQRLEAAAAATAGTLASSSARAADSLTAVSTTFGDGAARMERMVQVFDAALDKYQASLIEFSGALEVLKHSARAVSGAAGPIADGVGQLRAAAGTVGEAVQRLSGVASGLERSAAATQQSHDAAVQLWAAYQERFKDVDVALKNAFVQLHQGTEAFATQIKDFVTQVDAEMAKAVGLLSGVVNEFQGSVEDLEDVLKPTRK